MSRILKILAALMLTLSVGGCRSAKQTEASAGREWTNVSMPVKVRVTQPQKMTLSGTATMVRGEYVFISLRVFGFEVAQLYADKKEADVVMKQPSKLWLQTDIENRLRKGGISFAALQETLLGNREFLSKVPKGVDVSAGGTESRPSVTIRAEVKGKPIEMELSWDLGAAKWDAASPKRFTPPGTNYRKITPEQAMKALGNV